MNFIGDFGTVLNPNHMTSCNLIERDAELEITLVGREMPHSVYYKTFEEAKDAYETLKRYFAIQAPKI